MTDGFIPVYKEKGCTSFDVIYKLRKSLNIEKIGHTGTLDPMATGVLVVALGKATKFINYLPSGSKEYEATFKLGIRTDTFDITGNILNQTDASEISFDKVKSALEKFLGEIYQIPPMFSAVSKDGVRLYKLARQGKDIEREAKKITISSIEILLSLKDEYKIRVNCSSGTYIRSLVSDLGELLGVGAVLTELERTKANEFTLKDCFTLNDINNDKFSVVPVEKALCGYNSVCLSEAQSKRFLNGGELSLDRLNNCNVKNLYKVFSPKKKFLGLGMTNLEKKVLKVEKTYKENEKTVVALGNFDGVHLAHKEVFHSAIEMSNRLSCNPVAMYFKEHPKKIIGNDEHDRILFSSDEKDKKIKSLGMKIAKINFLKVMKLEPEDFIKRVLIDEYNVAGICCGFNYTFGIGGKGNTEDLGSICEKHNLELRVVDAIKYRNLPISSTRIRNALENGEIEAVNDMLGENYSYSYRVVQGAGRGRSILGFPTINQVFREGIIIPKNGVYTSIATILGKKHNSVTNIGKRPTFGEEKSISETHVLNFDEDCYGEIVKIELIKFLREEKKFESISELKLQMSCDIEKTKKSLLD